MAPLQTPLPGLALAPGPDDARQTGATSVLVAAPADTNGATSTETAAAPSGQATKPAPLTTPVPAMATTPVPATAAAATATAATPAAPATSATTTTSAREPAAPIRFARRMTPNLVDVLTLAVAGAAVALFVLNVKGLATRPWNLTLVLVLGAAFAVADLARIDFEVGEHAVTTTLGQTIFIASFFGLGAVGAVVARVIGGTAAVAPYWRGRRRKLFFNAALYGFEATAGASVFFAIAGTHPDPTMPRAWLAALATIVATAVITSALVATAIYLADSAAQVPLTDIVGLGLIAETANASIGLIAAIVVQRSPRSAVLMVIPAAVVYAAYRGYVRLSERHKSLARLHQFTTELQRAPELYATLRTTIRETAQTLRARRADMLLLAGGPDGAGLWVTLDASGNLSPFGEVATWREHSDVAAVINAAEGARLDRDTSGVDAVIAPVIVRGAVLGTLAARDRLGHAALFTDEDLTVLSTLANHAAVSLENTLLNEELQIQAVEREQEARHDTLTGLANRRAFEQDLKSALHASGAEARPGAVIVIDLRGFKDINETLGHEAGDRLLLVVAERLLGVCDPAHGERRLARLGGDEFVIVSQPCTAREAITVAEQARAEIERPIVLNGLQLVVSAAIGIACFPAQAGDEITLMQRADAALASAKERPEEPIQLYANQHDRSTGRRLTLAADLREAIEAEDLLVYYQPQVELATRRVVGAEALMRWHHPTLGWIAPDEFIAVAEGAGLIGKITRYVLHCALSQAAAWADAGIDIEMSVNVSARNLLEESLPADIAALLRRYHVAGSKVTLEITETEIMRDPEQTIDVLDRLNALGLRVSIDDFGTGYSSLSYLRRLPVTEVKIDKSFVLQMDTNPNDAMLAKTVVDLAANLSMRVVAEGIETQESWDALAAMGCERGQGFFFARPMPAVEMTNLLRSVA